jgi:acyl carrier protein
MRTRSFPTQRSPTVDDLTNRLLTFVGDEVSLGDLVVEGDTDLLLTGAVDSLGVIRITQWLHDEIGIEVDPAHVTLDNFQTVDRMVTYARSRGAV